MYKDHYEAQSKHWWFVAKKEIVLKTILNSVKNLNPDHAKILDAGCGCGLMLNDLQKLGQTSGMDFSEEAIHFSQKIFSGVIKKGNLPNEVPFSENYFDLLIALDVIEHIDDDIGALKTFFKILKKDGYGVLTVPAYMFLWSEHDEINHHKRRYTLTEFRNKIVRAGFKIEKISYFNTFLFPIILLIRNFNRLLRRKSLTDVDLPNQSVNFILFKIFSLEQYFLKYFNFSFGVSILAVIKKV